MGVLIATAFGLGLAGIDPAGALIAIAALARGVSSRGVVAFAAIVVIGTAALGAVLSLTVGQALGEVDWVGLLPQGDGGALVEIAVAAALLVWAGFRLRSPSARPKRPKRERGSGAAGLAGIGVVFAASAVLDPTYVGLVVIAGRDEPAAAVVVAHALWVVVSQLPLVAVAVAVALGAHTRLVARFERLWARIAPAGRVALTALLVVAGLVLALDGGKHLVTGRFLIAPGP